PRARLPRAVRARAGGPDHLRARLLPAGADRGGLAAAVVGQPAREDRDRGRAGLAVAHAHLIERPDRRAQLLAVLAGELVDPRREPGRPLLADDGEHALAFLGQVQADAAPVARALAADQTLAFEPRQVTGDA